MPVHCALGTPVLNKTGKLHKDMRLTHLADYAVVILTAAAARNPGDRLNATTLALETGLPLPTTQKVLSKLGTAGLLTGTRGIGGGFVFARSPSSITLADIVEAVEGPIAMTQCSGSPDASDCALDAHCRVKPHMTLITSIVRDALAGVSLEQLCAPAAAQGQHYDLQQDRIPALAGERS